MRAAWQRKGGLSSPPGTDWPDQSSPGQGRPDQTRSDQIGAGQAGPEQRRGRMQQATLNNGQTMPMLGLGTYTLSGSSGVDVMLDALELGYRLLDTAKMYGNEREVGQAVLESGLARREIFITSKLNRPCASYQKARQGIATSLEALQTDYIDLMLVHEPYEAWEEMYQALEDAVAEGTVRSIGISSFGLERCKRLYAQCRITPALNQLENHIYFQQDSLVGWLKEQGTCVQAWSPFGEGRAGICSHPVLTATGRKYGKTAAQVALRFLVQRGIAVVPKSSHRQRLAENMAIFDFQLTEEDMQVLQGMDTGKSLFSWSWI